VQQRQLDKVARQVEAEQQLGGFIHLKLARGKLGGALQYKIEAGVGQEKKGTCRRAYGGIEAAGRQNKEQRLHC
jgi:hypothetical protein